MKNKLYLGNIFLSVPFICLFKIIVRFTQLCRVNQARTNKKWLIHILKLGTHLMISKEVNPSTVMEMD